MSNWQRYLTQLLERAQHYKVGSKPILYYYRYSLAQYGRIRYQTEKYYDYYVLGRGSLPSSPNNVQVPLLITGKMRQRLSAKGYSAADIKKMTPQQAWSIIQRFDSVEDADHHHLSNKGSINERVTASVCDGEKGVRVDRGDSIREDNLVKNLKEEGGNGGEMGHLLEEIRETEKEEAKHRYLVPVVIADSHSDELVSEDLRLKGVDVKKETAQTTKDEEKKIS